MSTPTTGFAIAARVVITSSPPTLILSNTNTDQRVTYQIRATVTDVTGNALDPQPELYYNIVAGHDIVDVSDSGVLTARLAGLAIVQVSAAAFGNTINLFTVDGVPINAIYAEQSVQVAGGYILPDFQFSLDYSGGIYTISQTPVPNSTWNGTVDYSIGQRSAYPGSDAPAVIATISGTGTATFTHNSNSFKLQGTDQTNGVYHACYTYLDGGPVSPIFPQTSVRGLADGPNGTSNSGQPRTVGV